MKERLQLVVTKHAMSVISDPEKATTAERAVVRAMGFVEGVEFENPRTLMIENSALGVHVDPKRGLVIILSKFPGFPAVTDDLVNELLPLTATVGIA